MDNILSDLKKIIFEYFGFEAKKTMSEYEVYKKSCLKNGFEPREEWEFDILRNSFTSTSFLTGEKLKNTILMIEEERQERSG